MIVHDHSKGSLGKYFIKPPGRPHKYYNFCLVELKNPTLKNTSEHKGLRSVARAYGGQNTFWRLAVGVGKPTVKSSLTTEQYLEQILIQKELDKVYDSCDEFIDNFFVQRTSTELPRHNVILVGSKKQRHIIREDFEGEASSLNI